MADGGAAGGDRDGRGRPRAHRARLLAAVLAAAALLPAGCGGDFRFETGPPPGEAAPLAATYDITADYPGLVFPEFPATSLSLDLTMEIDPNSVGALDGSIAAAVTIHEAKVGGVARTFAPTAPISVTGRLIGDDLDLHPFGPVTVGSTVLFPDLHGKVADDGRRIDGLALLANTADQGTWFAIKQRRYLVAATDFSLVGTASVVTVRYGNRFLVDRNVEITSGDPVAASSHRHAFIVNRLWFDNIQVLDPARGFLTALQFSTGNASNPQDALMTADGRLYIPRYEPPFDDVLVADPATGAALGTIPLEAYATNGTGTPRPARAIEVNGLVMVTLQNIDALFSDYGPGLAVFIDPATDAVLKVVTLEGRNPFGPPSIHPVTGEVYLADAGIFAGTIPRSLSGGVEVIDPVSLTTKGILADDDDLGGNVSGVAVTSATRAYAVVVTETGANSVVAFDPAGGALQGVLYTTTALIPEIRYDGDGYLLVVEHDYGSPALRILDAASGSQVIRIAMSLPPVSVAVLSSGTLNGD